MAHPHSCAESLGIDKGQTCGGKAPIRWRVGSRNRCQKKDAMRGEEVMEWYSPKPVPERGHLVWALDEWT